LHHVNELIDNLKAAPQGENFCNPATNGCGITVTSYSGSGGAAFMICGVRVSNDIYLRQRLDPVDFTDDDHLVLW
jgi:hypothetical protein